MLNNLCLIQIFLSVTPPQPPKDPCAGNPCGPYSVCRRGGPHARAACTCQQGYFGQPPNCRPECVVDSDCSSNQERCVQNKCVNPCRGACGLNAFCEYLSAISHFNGSTYLFFCIA